MFNQIRAVNTCVIMRLQCSKYLFTLDKNLKLDAMTSEENSFDGWLYGYMIDGWLYG